jgi:predicted MPP superfamily phosphohydrolase
VRRRRRWLRAAIAALAAAALVHAFAIEPRWLEVTRHRMRAPVAAPLTVAHLADLHTRGLGSIERSVLDALERERPDLVAITGDTIDRGDWTAAGPFLERVRAPLGVFLVDGNWEHWSGARADDAFFRSLGVQRLRNESARAREDLWVAGLDDATAGAPDPEAAIRGVPPRAALLVLFHSPSYFDVLAPRLAPRGEGVLALAGHTHGGQLRVPFLGAPWRPPGSGRFVSGWYESEGARLHVGRGVGTSILPARFACRPELALIRIEP